MKIVLDTDRRELIVQRGEEAQTLPLHSPEAFEILSREWVRIGWGQKYSYRYTWLGRPVIQLPQDLIVVQEVIFANAPDVIVETGIAHGGSLIFHASLFELMGRGRVVGIDVEIRPHNRAAIEAHPLFHRIELIEGDAVAPATVAQVRDGIGADEEVMVILDSNHSRDHVLAELEAYAPLATPGQFVVVEDGVMRDLTDVPGGEPGWDKDNPLEAAGAFLAAHPEFEQAPPEPLFCESPLRRDLNTHWPDAWLRRRAGA